MTVDLLSQRLKQAKRELTALKTAHSRGLGNLRIFSEEFDGAPSVSPGQKLTINISFSIAYAPYPFFQVLSRNSAISYTDHPGILDIEYNSSGYGATVTVPSEYVFFFGGGGFALSMSPITSISYG